MDNKDKPAFPLRGKDGLLFDNNDSGLIPHLMIGLNKRELFTFGAMVGLISNGYNPAGLKQMNAGNIAHKAAEIADTTLNELAKNIDKPVNK